MVNQEASLQPKTDKTTEQTATEKPLSEEEAARKLRQKLKELGFSISTQDRKNRDSKSVKVGPHSAQYIATQTYELDEGGTNTITIAYTPIKSYGKIFFALQTYINQETIHQINDAHSTELCDIVAKLMVMGFFNIPIEQLSWKEEYLQKQAEIKKELDEIRLLTSGE